MLNKFRKDPGFLVNFLLAGTQKGGTTALWKFLSQDSGLCLASQPDGY